ncbi:DUF4153 domain-containing protein [Fulvivirga sediminis]|uniref:DUF4153 domain-containing protein n=1 Tax=Fulvivirga sediminis TaxID=2803949 RepID=A0A937F9T9_9BACT|nr:DUF4153 domain-containing protein [Fulvivirga sediminis]MBL3656929.1 DUF4153 domain-containing protein [Fulvivirga sediminis]
MISIKTPNIRETGAMVYATIKRFPLAVISGCIAVFASCYFVDLDFESTELKNTFLRLIMVSSLGIAYFTALKLMAESLGQRFWKYVLGALGVVCLVIYYSVMSADLQVVDWVRYILFGIIAHLMVSFAPFLLVKGKEGFWRYNKNLFLQIVTAFFFAMVIYMGLALALLALDKLFDINFSSKLYLKLFYVVSGLFSMLYFLGGMPRQQELYADEEAFSKGLSVFTQYILIPLVGIYNLILYIYTIKILISWDWPRGWLGYLFISYAVLGILSYLLIYPLAQSGERGWLRVFSRWFFFSLIPLVVVLFLAIYRRVDEYGLTENRYFLYLLDFWLLGMAVYFSFFKNKNIKIVPLSLAIVILLSSFGPWGAFGWSARNQVNRFQGLIKKAEAGGLSFNERKDVSSVIHYLARRRKLAHLQPYFKADVDSLYDHNYSGYAEVLLREYEIDYVNEWQRDSTMASAFSYYSIKQNYYLNVGDYDQFLSCSQVGSSGPIKVEDWENLVIDSLKTSINLKPFITQLKKKHSGGSYDMEPDQLMLEGENDDIKFKIYFLSVSLRRDADGQYEVQGLGFNMFFKKKGKK